MLRYIDRDLIWHLLVTLVAILAFVQIGYFVSVLLDMSTYLFGSGDSKLGWVFWYYILTIPRSASFALPVATGIAVLWVFTIKGRQNETLAYLAGGVGPTRLAWPMITVSLALSIGCFFLLEYVATPADREARNVERIKIENRGIETLHRERNVFQKGQGNRFYNIRSFDPARETMVLPIVIELTQKGEAPVMSRESAFDMAQHDWAGMAWRLDAKSAERKDFGSGPEWVFVDAVFRRYKLNGEVGEYKAAPVIRQSELTVKLEDELTNYLQQRSRPAEMSIGELNDYIAHARYQGKMTAVYEMYRWEKFTIPLGTLILTLLMCAHILRPAATGVVYGFGTGLFFIAAYYLMLIGGRQLAHAGIMLPIIAAIVPNVACIGVAILLLNKNRAV